MFILFISKAQSSQYADSRCICVCPEPNLVVKEVKITTNRTVYIPATTPPPSEWLVKSVFLHCFIDGWK